MWYEILVADEFIDYFSNDNNVFFTVENEKEILAPTFMRFRKIIYGITAAFSNQAHADLRASDFRNAKEYDALQGFNFCIEQIASLNLNRYYLFDLFHSIPDDPNRSKYDIDTEELSAEQCAVLIMYQFWRRMGFSLETSFQESGELKKYLLALKDKVDKEKTLAKGEQK